MARLVVGIRELKQIVTLRRHWVSSNKSFNEQNNSCAHTFWILENFLLSSGKQQRQMTSTMYFREHKPQWSFLKEQWSWTGEILFTPPPPLSFLLPMTHPLGRTFFLFQVFHCMKNSRWWPNFLRCECSLKEISPALQAIWHIFISLCFHINYSNFWIP